MKKIVEMARNSTEANGRDRFSCSIAVWELLQELGLAFGWRQHGTTYVAPPSLKKLDAPARHNYQPGDALDYKRLDAEDAMAWAGALDSAKQSPHFSAMLEECWTRRVPDGTACPPTLHSLILEFTEYAYGGGFVFANARLQQPPATAGRE